MKQILNTLGRNLEDLQALDHGDFEQAVGDFCKLAEELVGHARRMTSPTVASPSQQKNVFHIVPLDGEAGDCLLSIAIKSSLAAEITLLIHPGVYFDNLTVSRHVRIEGVGGKVTLMPKDSQCPLIVAAGNKANLTICGLNFICNESDSVPAVHLSDSSHCYVEQCTWNGGSSAVYSSGSGTSLTLIGCVISDSAFAGIYGNDRATIQATNCNFMSCETALRLFDCFFSVTGCTVKDSRSDGVVLHGASCGSVTQCSIGHSKDNGLTLSPSTQLIVSSSIVSRNGQFGIYAPRGATFSVPNSTFCDNELGSYNRNPSNEGTQ